ncbi:rhomboid family intramembrane serine protease [Natrarchaeobius oligotrophus]|uniref:Rhomboid family intramembrane serine protease n=1 Tax=Natrarchaeobius chitinivorans TaxID=1679083 RepID=A0A3N6MI61_NATCH|nr:rhomboid family intramembrane serine protease [Natrarchaeobius chitinivorans]RQG93726.1 rhomboid family intramembrane serine protease [Natrarchaeobius chitinivorans]
MGLRSKSEPAAITKSPADETWGEALGRNPVVQTLVIMMGVSIVGWAATGGQGVPDGFALSMPIDEPWWSLITATYGHLDTAHFLSNATVIVIAGGLIALSTSAIRFHVFFIATGVLAAIGQVYLADVFGTSVAVIGTSGSAFALAGYVIGSVSTGSESTRTAAVGPLTIVLLLIAGGATIWFSPQGTAFGSHFIGILLGLVAGRLHLLRVK